MFSLVSNRLGGQVVEQKQAGTLGKVKMPNQNFGKTADTAVCNVAYDMFSAPIIILRYEALI